jgi:hypothetical protein
MRDMSMSPEPTAFLTDAEQSRAMARRVLSQIKKRATVAVLVGPLGLVGFALCIAITVGGPKNDPVPTSLVVVGSACLVAGAVVLVPGIAWLILVRPLLRGVEGPVHAATARSVTRSVRTLDTITRVTTVHLTTPDEGDWTIRHAAPARPARKLSDPCPVLVFGVLGLGQPVVVVQPRVPVVTGGKVR